MNLDVIVSWPRNADYPLWRQFIRDNRSRFRHVVVVFTETNQGKDTRPFVTKAMFEDRISFYNSPPISGDQDWRNVAVNFALEQIDDAGWIWFTEQDFYPQEGFWEAVGERMGEYFGVLGVLDGDRLHPCCLFMTHPCLELAGRNFGIEAGKLDHFGRLQAALEARNVRKAILPPNTYYHMAGLSHNLRLMADNQPVTYKPDEFMEYLKKCLKVKVPIDDGFKMLAQSYMDAKRD